MTLPHETPPARHIPSWLRTTVEQPLNSSNASALCTTVGIDDATGHGQGHIGLVCDLLIDAGHWIGIDIAQALNHDGTTRE
ncbi:hypothetical protein [Rhodococcus rhodochrous]|uniref:hypothetical protein n=1 Tax=Rhodococcus rhodochrous TaxID=1829 RepID=UPI00177C282F|nr:hypothetical protein [Rhodococcus rhodochrous]QOH59597.1 hypothetical protein C6Y44_26270 [Rhodococcus rhodochrous]